MSLKEMLKQSFSNPKEIILERYKAAKFAFIVTSFSFFLNFYFVGAHFYSNFFSSTLNISYVLLLLSIVFFVYFLVKLVMIDKPNKYINFILFILLFSTFIVLLLPIVFK
jgi:hypothetical protein